MQMTLPDNSLVRIALVIAAAAMGHFLVIVVRRAVARLAGPGTAATQRDRATSGKLMTVLWLVTSAVTFAIYFVALGLVLRELGINMTAYFASASVIGLAIGFGSQGMVQDVVIGLTLIFSDAMDIGDTVEVSGQVGRVERVGLRFTTLTNAIGQTVFIPNRNIAVVGRFRHGVVRAYMDVQIPDDADDGAVLDTLRRLVAAAYAQHGGVLLTAPEVGEPRRAGPAGWRYARIKFRVWPGQTAVVENAIRQRILGAMRRLDDGYADWMVTVTYRVS